MRRRLVCAALLCLLLACATALAESGEVDRAAVARGMLNGEKVDPHAMFALGYADFKAVSDDLVKVQSGGDDRRWGLIDATGAEVLPLEFDEIRCLDDLLYLEKNTLHGLMDLRTMAYTPPRFDQMREFSEGTLCVREAGSQLYGYIDRAGEYVIEPRFFDARAFSQGLAAVKVEMPGGYNPVVASGEEEHDVAWGYIDATGAMVIEPRFSVAEDFTRWGYAVAKAFMEEKQGVIDRQGDWLLALDYNGDNLYRFRIRIQDDGVVQVIEGDQVSEHVSAYYDLSSGEAREARVMAASVELEDYMPFTGGKVAALDEPPTLDRRASYDDPLPCLDGATALFPVYAAFVQAVYPSDTRYEAYTGENRPLVTCTKTNVAYERLINGEADVIFVAAPSDEERRMAEEKGVEFDMIPFGREAFVFVVNQRNPLEDITVEELRLIYSGEITLWSQVGVDGLGEIIPYQRPKNSGSQTALEALMGDVPLMEAPQEVVAWDMGDILDNVGYRNLPNALGYSFRFFCTDMMQSEVKLLALDGVEPTPENIANGTYPQSSTLYAIRLRGNDNPNVQALLDWIQSDQGMELIEKSGYVSLRQQR